MSSSTVPKTNVTIAFLGPYKWIPGLTYNGTLVTNDIFTAVNMSNFVSSFFRPTAQGVFYWQDIGAALTVQNINNDPTILPNIHINIKRFNDWGPTPGKSPGYAMVHTVPEMIADPEIIAIFGDFDRKTTVYSAQIMSLAQLPLCGVETFSFPMLNRNKYPYLFQMMSVSGFAENLYQLLKTWNVQRVALIFSFGNKDWAAQALHTAEYLSQHGIQILVKLNSDLAYKPGGNDYIGQMLKIVDARYMIAVTDVFSMAQLYYGLASTNSSVGNDYVWIGGNPPIVNGDGAELFGSDKFYTWSRGFVFVAGSNPTSEYTARLGDTFTKQIVNITKPLGGSPTIQDLWNVNVPMMYDCINLYAHGFKNLLNSNPTFTPQMLATRQLQQYMNATLYAKTGYRGLGGDPYLLSIYGDMAAPGMYFSLPGDSVFPDPIPFAVSDSEWSSFNYFPNYTLAFFDGTNRPPPDGPIYTEQILLPSNGGGRALIALGGVGIVFSLFSLFITLACQKTSTIRNGSVLFLSLISIGSAFPYASMFFHIYRAASISCNARIWLPLIGYSIIFGSIFVKNMRMHIIFTPEYSFPPTFLKDWSLVTVLCFLVGLEAVFVGLFAGNSPMHGIYTLGPDLTFTYACSFAPREASYPSILLWAYNALLLIGTLATGILTWNVKPQFNESTYIYLITICTGVMSLLLLGIGQSNDATTLSSLVQAIMIWTITTFCMVLLFGPKILVLVFDAKDGSLTTTFMSSLRSSLGSKRGSNADQSKTMVSAAAGAAGGRKRIASMLESSHAPGQSSVNQQTSMLGNSSNTTSDKIAKPIAQNVKYGVCYTRIGKDGLEIPWVSAVLGMYPLRGKTVLVFLSQEEPSFAINLPKNVMIINVKELNDVPEFSHTQFRVGVKCVSTKLDIKIDFKKSDQAEDCVVKLKELLSHQK
ncbi:periplasmic binding protein-like I [Obelidium mucronatum]|nr:periplasmic binding protein-like I [Obelidium mucronatum]